MPLNPIDITGQIIGNFEILSYYGYQEKKIGKDRKIRKQHFWVAKCLLCDKSKPMMKEHIKNQKACGCLLEAYRKKAIRPECWKNAQPIPITKLYKVYRGILNRCYNPKSRAYSYYGGRGITVCEEWKNDYEFFKTWAELNGYTEGKSIDRINNNKGYYPANCHWTTSDIQNINNRRNRWVNCYGVLMPVQHALPWAEVKMFAFYDRVKKGWTEEEALFTPKHCVPERFKSYN